ncbi:hypothetical protein F3Y22_tig00112281pilonHSYRG00172 [Hibiscus syriacus]|uniref:Uncharacterized protein n=1 Tax=Hibiscus syriacus TaxID=106335 RepID=A0A6A2X2R6_HIBSY|nr:uncharacterized protein LOC120177052 [Hibiscus syriacus]KAE8668928.1 hypothetical protein F3Y22_tig00112281pilonHSYRG00172 [Hibiscus syriacus]
MEFLPKPIIPETLKRYWRRRRNQRLYGSEARKNIKVTRIGRRSRRFWKIRATPRLRWRMMIASPMKLLTKLKNGYMNTLLRLGGTVGYLSANNEFGGKRIPKARKVALGYSNSEFDQRLLYEIYKNLCPALELHG